MKEKVNSASLPSYVMDTNSQKTKRLYRVWKGSNRFLFGGRLIFGPDVKSMIITVFLIVIPVLLFICFVSHRLIYEFKHCLGNLIIIIAAVFAAYIIIVLFLTSGRDPGIIPRNTHPPEPEHDSVGSSNLSADWGVQAGHPSFPAFKEILVNGVAVKIKYCQTCMLYRPPRCSHCSICNNCIERFDHHCPWVGQCIGKRNYRFFFMFVSSTTMLCLYVFAFCWVNLIKIMGAYHCTLWKAISMSPVSAILIIYTFIAAWFVGGLTAFHTYLVCTNQTTYENFRYRYDGKMKNPYNRGCFLNIKEIFFSSIPKSKNNFRAKVKEDRPTLTSSLSFNNPTSHDMHKSIMDLEDNRKRHAVAEEEIDDIQSQMGSMSGIERCGTQKGNWEIMSDDIEAVSGEFKNDHVSPKREKINGNI